MPYNRTSDYAIRGERWCRSCNARTQQLSLGYRYSTKENTTPNILVRNVTWLCQHCDHEETESKEVTLPSDRIKLIARFLRLKDDYDILGMQIQSTPDELVLRLKLPEFDLGEMRAIQYKQRETGFITVDELMRVQRGGYKRPAAVPPRPQPTDVATLRKREKQRAFAGDSSPYWGS